MSELPRRSGPRRLRVFRWLRKGRFVVSLVFAALVFWIITSPFARRVPALNALFDKLERAEHASLDLRFRWRGEEPPHPQIAILAVTKPFLAPEEVHPEELAKSEALRAMGEKEFPWRRKVWVEVLDKLFSAGASVVAFDIVFAAKNQDDPEFAAALQKYPGKVVLAMTVQDVSPDPNTSQLQVFYANADLLAAAKGPVSGCAVVHPDEDSTVRSIDHFTSELRELGIEDSSKELPSLSALAVQLFTGSPSVAGQGQLLRYQGGRQTYPYLPVHSLFEPAIYANPKLFNNGEVFREKIVFIGATYEMAHDDKMTPFGIMAGVEVHAQAAADLLAGAKLRNVSSLTGWFLTLLATFSSVAAIALLRRAWAQVVALVGLAAIYVLAAHVGFTSFDRVLPMMAPLIGLAATGAFGVVGAFAVEQWEKAHTRKVLERSVNKRIAKVLLQNAEEFDQARRGERRPVAILFSDIRNFTTWSERAEPEHLVGQLNEYFERMVELVERESSLGNAQKFIGDAILAAWGDTPENRFGDAEDARRAVAVALEMRAAVKDLNSVWAQRNDRISISIGMGINLGDVVVGEVGHPDRREFTVLGDGVNFAARLESATKQFHTDCLVGERVEELTRQHFIFRHVDNLRVKGKTKPVNVYMLIGDRKSPTPEWLEDYHRARALYVERKFTEAAALFRAVGGRIGEEDYLCEMYAARCDTYAQQPPPPDWDGSYTMTDK